MPRNNQVDWMSCKSINKSVNHSGHCDRTQPRKGIICSRANPLRNVPVSNKQFCSPNRDGSDNEHQCSKVDEHRCSKVDEHRCSRVGEHRCSKVDEHRCSNVDEHRCSNVDEHRCSKTNRQLGQPKHQGDLDCACACRLPTALRRYSSPCKGDEFGGNFPQVATCAKSSNHDNIFTTHFSRGEDLCKNFGKNNTPQYSERFCNCNKCTPQYSEHFCINFNMPQYSEHYLPQYSERKYS